ncbi:MAG: nucleotidyltransferase domain-containing protein [candidate division KSB1 bacterium]|nr:nucleotidyltransferase domain-containing protein [candidate division KSB1 bacterium]MDZ7303874.1 nucleotidyltransferase domain-containing protein [candidate division KSB1 bacterium]MDZ7313202.1 nucleotidyltransferase domain-containing protein [candidate division KSB1 bacterium]
MKTDFKKQAQIDLQRLLDKLIAGYKPEKVILFGSYAYGNPTRDSDLDLLIVKETSQIPFLRRVEVRRICYDLQRRTPIQPLVITPEELRERIEMGDPFLLEIVRKGKTVYEAGRVKVAEGLV